jgi:hypothetical protein
MYEDAVTELGLSKNGAAWALQNRAGKANEVFRTSTLPAIAARVREMCPKCEVGVDRALWGSDASAFVGNISTDAEVPFWDETSLQGRYRSAHYIDPFLWLGRSSWQPVATLRIAEPEGPGSHELVIIFNALPLKPGMSDYFQPATEFMSVMSLGPDFVMLSFLNRFGNVYRIAMLGFEASAYLFMMRFRFEYSVREMLFSPDVHLGSIFMVFDAVSMFVQYCWPVGLWSSPFDSWDASNIKWPLWHGAWQTMYGFNTLLMLLVFLRLSTCWTPFRLFVSTMKEASETLKYFLITVGVAIMFVSTTGHTMFGLTSDDPVSSAPHDGAFDMVTRVFDVLMNSNPAYSEASQYRGVYIVYYLMSNSLFLLIMSQFLVSLST